MPVSKPHLDLARDVQDRLRGVGREARDLADAFAKTGNDVVAHKLFQWARTQEDAAEDVGALVGAVLDSDVRDARGRVGDLFYAALRGAEDRSDSG